MFCRHPVRKRRNRDEYKPNLHCCLLHFFTPHLLCRRIHMIFEIKLGEQIEPAEIVLTYSR
jgi:hypothetical protein